jgi:FtsZ-binding cell division protein ZapB
VKLFRQQLIAQAESETAQLDEKIVQEAAAAGLVETDIEHLKEEVAKVEVPDVKRDGEQLEKDILTVHEALAGLVEQIRVTKAVEERRKQ